MPMMIPGRVSTTTEGQGLLDFSLELIEQCEQSRQPRILQYANWRSLYLTGTSEGDPAPRNMMFSHIDNLAAYLYSPRQVRFLVGYDYTSDEDARLRGRVASAHLSRKFHQRDIDMAFEDAVEWGLVKGSAFVKLLWGHGGMDAYVVHPDMMGVYREDINGLDKQECFFHSMYLTPGEFSRLLVGHPRKAQILRDVQPLSSPDEDPMRASLFKQIVIGQNQPISTTTPSNNPVGNVSWVSGGMPFLPPEVAKQLIRIDELWVQDEEREDWTTIQIAQKRIIIEGDVQHRNVCDVKGYQPFYQVCPNRMNGYFWGMSEITQLETLQNAITSRITGIDRIEALQARPPLSMTGSGRMNQELYDALMSPGGFLSEAEPGVKLENMAPKLPESAYADLDRRFQWFHDQSGISPTLRGENQPGVRAGGHAETLVRTGSPRILDRALGVERNLEELGDFALRLEQVKTARLFQYKGEDGKPREMLLDSLPEDFLVTVDSHSASPAFSEEAKGDAYAMRKAGAISDIDLIRLIHPPQEDSLIAAAEKRAADQAKFLAEHPEAARKQNSKRK